MTFDTSAAREKPNRKGLATDPEAPAKETFPWPQRVAVSQDGVIATAHYRATEAGAEILGSGGNVFDAAVAAAFALGVVEPAASGLGGQTMTLLHHAASGRTIALDGSSRAPNRATAEAFSKETRRRGYRATTVPSTPAVLRYILERFGRLKLRRVLEPAIRLAEDGYEVTPLQWALTRRELRYLRSGTAAPLFLRDGRNAFPVGSLFRQPVLAETLRRMARRGVKDFYTGEIAHLIARDMKRNDGLIREDDLAQVPRPIERRPVTTRFQGHRLFTMPLPGAGRTLVQTLNVFQALPRTLQDLDTPRGAVALAEIIRLAFADRHDRPFDPSFFPQVAAKKMLSPDYAASLARKCARKLSGNGETTHLSAMDREGNAIALTQSIEKVFGSASATPELGFLYNNYMSSFEFQDISHPYYLRPNAAPWGSVAPTIVFRGKRPWVAIGSPGSERITSAILQVLIRLSAVAPFFAVDAPRLHSSMTGKVALEATRMRNDVPEALLRHGFEVEVKEPYAFYLGCVQLAIQEGSELVAVADPRRDGSASGPLATARARGAPRHRK